MEGVSLSKGNVLAIKNSDTFCQLVGIFRRLLESRLQPNTWRGLGMISQLSGSTGCLGGPSGPRPQASGRGPELVEEQSALGQNGLLY